MDESVFLRYVDAWGDTVFNQAQIPKLISELRKEVGNQRDAETIAHLKKVIRLVERAIGRTHTHTLSSSAIREVMENMHPNHRLQATHKSASPFFFFRL
jgi:hypothetical protein